MLPRSSLVYMEYSTVPDSCCVNIVRLLHSVNFFTQRKLLKNTVVTVQTFVKLVDAYFHLLKVFYLSCYKTPYSQDNR